MPYLRLQDVPETLEQADVRERQSELNHWFALLLAKEEYLRSNDVQALELIEYKINNHVRFGNWGTPA